MTYTTLSPQDQFLVYNSDSLNSGIFVSGESNYGYMKNTGPILNDPSGIDDLNTYSGRAITNGNSGLLEASDWQGRRLHRDLTLDSDILNVLYDDGSLSGTVNTSGLSIFRPQWDPTKKRNVYVRSSPMDPDEEAPTADTIRSLSTSNNTKYPDFLFQEYIHYMPNPAGGQGLLDLSPSEVKNQVTISRNIRTKTWSPYS